MLKISVTSMHVRRPVRRNKWRGCHHRKRLRGEGGDGGGLEGVSEKNLRIPFHCWYNKLQWRIQTLRLAGGGGTFLGFQVAPPPLQRFSWSHYESLYLDFFRISICTPPPFTIFSEATIKVYTWIFLTIFPEATIKVYTWIFHDFDLHPPPPLPFFLKPL